MSHYIARGGGRWREEGGWGVLPLQGISPQLPGYSRVEGCKGTEKAFQACSYPVFCLLAQISKKDSCTLLTLHLTLLLNKISGTAFLLHIDSFNPIHSENYRGNKIIRLPTQTPAMIILFLKLRKTFHFLVQMFFQRPSNQRRISNEGNSSRFNTGSQQRPCISVHYTCFKKSKPSGYGS